MPAARANIIPWLERRRSIHERGLSLGPLPREN
jgi:hypothetical protein